MADLPLPKIVPPLDPGFRPAALYHRLLADTPGTTRVVIGVQRPDGNDSRHETLVIEGDPASERALERTVKFLLWQRGAHKVMVGAPTRVANLLKNEYNESGVRAFDVDLIGNQVCEHVLEIEACRPEDVPPSAVASKSVGRHTEGCRVGFDLGASDRKAAAVVDGKEVFTEEKVWDPAGNSDPEYHYREIKAAIDSAAAHLPRLDAIGGSSAGVVVDNRVMVASIFRGIAKSDYPKARDVFLRLQREYGVPLEVANDGDVTALAGSMSLDEGRVLGIAMGSSLAAGYVDERGNITGWLNELAFAPIDYAQDAHQDEWSKDIGCGVQYLTQQAVFRLAPLVGIDLSGTDVLAEKLKIVQDRLHAGHDGARQIWQTIGIYFGYAIAHYAAFYDLARVLTLGRVTSGDGGAIILENAARVLEEEFPEVAANVQISLPDEKSRRVGQAVAAASLPSL